MALALRSLLDLDVQVASLAKLAGTECSAVTKRTYHWGKERGLVAARPVLSILVRSHDPPNHDNTGS